MFTQLQTNRQRYRQTESGTGRQWDIQKDQQQQQRRSLSLIVGGAEVLSLSGNAGDTIFITDSSSSGSGGGGRWRLPGTVTHTHSHTQCNRYLELLYLIDTFGSEGQLQLTPFARALLLAQLKVTPRKSRNGKDKRMNANEENYNRCSLRSLQFSSSFCAIFPHLTNAIIICYNFRQAKVGPGLAWLSMTWPGLALLKRVLGMCWDIFIFINYAAGTISKIWKVYYLNYSTAKIYRYVGKYL